MKTIESPYALTALRKMAEYTPERLLRMEKEEPENLLKEIEMRVANALGWTDTALGKGASEEKMDTAIDLLLKPDIKPGNEDTVPVSEQKINEIYQRLLSLAE
ncbi:MAG: hypothetical protein ACM3P1_08035 [Candidatus Saccharibacteria bacterium]